MIEAIRVCLQENEENLSDDIELDLEDFLDLFSTDIPETNNDSVQINMDAHYLIWWKGRNTSQVVTATSRDEAISKARKKGSAGSDGDVVKARQATQDEESAIRNGKWLRTRANGSTNSSTGSYKFRPQLKKKAKGNDVGI